MHLWGYDVIWKNNMVIPTCICVYVYTFMHGSCYVIAETPPTLMWYDCSKGVGHAQLLSYPRQRRIWPRLLLEDIEAQLRIPMVGPTLLPQLAMVTRLPTNTQRISKIRWRRFFLRMRGDTLWSSWRDSHRQGLRKKLTQSHTQYHPVFPPETIAIDTCIGLWWGI